MKGNSKLSGASRKLFLCWKSSNCIPSSSLKNPAFSPRGCAQEYKRCPSSASKHKCLYKTNSMRCQRGDRSTGRHGACQMVPANLPLNIFWVISRPVWVRGQNTLKAGPVRLFPWPSYKGAGEAAVSWKCCSAWSPRVSWTGGQRAASSPASSPWAGRKYKSQGLWKGNIAGCLSRAEHFVFFHLFFHQ